MLLDKQVDFVLSFNKSIENSETFVIFFPPNHAKSLCDYVFTCFFVQSPIFILIIFDYSEISIKFKILRVQVIKLCADD